MQKLSRPTMLALMTSLFIDIYGVFEVPGWDSLQHTR